MLNTKNRRFSKTSAANVFVGNDRFRGKVSWRLDVDRNVDFVSGTVNSLFFLKRRRRTPERYRNRLFHYIAAGGMSQLKRTTVDDLIEYRKRRFMVWVVILGIVWVVFYLLPSV
jgi:hypothetical protein